MAYDPETTAPVRRTYSLSGADAGKFTINANAAGALTFDGSPNFEARGVLLCGRGQRLRGDSEGGFDAVRWDREEHDGGRDGGGDQR